MKPTKFTKSLKAYAVVYGVSIATVKRWSAAGVDLDDPDAVELHVGAQKHQPENFTPDENTRPDEVVTVFAEHAKTFDRAIKILAANCVIEGESPKQSLTGHRRLINLMLLRFWKHTIRAMQGEKYEDFKELDPLLPE